jgi:hypothetical protein
MERHDRDSESDAGTDRQRLTGGDASSDPSGSTQLERGSSRLIRVRLRLDRTMHRPMLTLECRSRPNELQVPPRNLNYTQMLVLGT